MFPSLNLVFTALSFFGTVQSQTDQVTETLSVKNKSAASIVSISRNIPGIERVEVLFDTNSIRIVGNKNAVASYKMEAMSHDTPAKVHAIACRMFEYRVDKSGNFIQRNLINPRTKIADGLSSVIAVGASDSVNYSKANFKTLTLPDGKVVLDCSFLIRDSSTGINKTFAGTYLFNSGEKKNVIGFTENRKPGLSQRVTHGDVVTDMGPYRGLYVEISVD